MSDLDPLARPPTQLLPPRKSNESWWLCIEMCQDYERDEQGEMVTYPLPGHNEIERPNCRVYRPGHAYAFASELQLPAITEDVFETETRNGKEVPIFIDDPANPNPYADRVPLRKTEVDPDTGKRKFVTKRIGVAHFVPLGTDRREAEAKVQDFRDGMQIETGIQPARETEVPYDPEDDLDAMAAREPEAAVV